MIFNTKFNSYGKAFKVSAFYILILVIVALFSNILANSDFGIIPYGAGDLDFKNTNAVGPFDSQDVSSNAYRHWLGTDELGRDVLAGIIHGSKSAIFIGFGAMLIASLLGLFIGISAAWFGDNRLKTTYFKVISNSVLFLVFILASSSIVPWDIMEISLVSKLSYFLCIFLVYIVLVKVISMINKHANFKNNASFPTDLILSRLIELFDSLPLLLVIISLSAIVEASVFTIILILGATGWVSMAKFARAETLRIKNLEYIESAVALGLRDKQLLLKHILPNIATPILVVFAFGVSNAILVESTLSFLGIGLKVDEVSWGSILALARQDYNAWWLAVFPGFAIFCTVFSLNIIGNRLSK